MRPYAILSDQHCHKWSAFATVNEYGVNSRLQTILDEMERAADELIGAGGTEMYFAGDLFHTRGIMDPEVYNPTCECLKRIVSKGVSIHAIPGNHDLQSSDTTALGSSIQQLRSIDGFEVINEVDWHHASRMVMVPWRSSLEALLSDLGKTHEKITNPETYDVIIHAPVNGVVNIPDHGLDPDNLAKIGFRRVFSGHYHNHKIMSEGRVISIGATTHQSWRDIDSKAGFLLVDDKVHWRASHAPSFVEINRDTPEENIPLIVDGNYIRIAGRDVPESKANQVRQEFMDMGARGVVFQISRDTAATRSASAKPGATMEEAIDSYVDEIGLDYASEVKRRAVEILHDYHGE